MIGSARGATTKSILFELILGARLDFLVGAFFYNKCFSDYYIDMKKRRGDEHD